MEAPDSSVGHENRKTPRLKADLEVNLTTDTTILNHGSISKNEPYPLNLLGHTENISAEGLAFVVPSFKMDEDFCRDEKKSLQIGLALPNETVTLQASPVHCEPIDRRDPGQGYLLGVRIVRMDERAHEIYRRFLSAARSD